jgi:hypothetical protein
MRDWDDKLEAALRGLAESAREQAVAPSGAEIRRRAEMRRRRRSLLLPSALLTCTLAGGTAYGLTAGLGSSQPHTGPAQAGPAASQTVAPGHGGPATLPAGPGAGHSAAAPPASQPAGTGPAQPAPRLLQPLCELTKSHPYIAYVQGLSLQPSAGVLNIIPAACTPDPQDPSHGKLVPSGPVRPVTLAPGATIMVTSPIGPGTQPTPISLTQLAFGLDQHPGALFSITFGSGGRATRVTEIYVRGLGGPSSSAGTPSLGSGF